jgi:hypothetical protein
VWLPQQDTPLFLNSSRTQVLTIPLLSAESGWYPSFRTLLDVLFFAACRCWLMMVNVFSARDSVFLHRAANVES